MDSTTTEVGYYPEYNTAEGNPPHVYSAEFQTVHDGWRRYVDSKVGFGFLTTPEGTRLPAYIIDWPNPEFMSRDNYDSAFFILRYMDEVATPQYIQHWKDRPKR